MYRSNTATWAVLVCGGCLIVLTLSQRAFAKGQCQCADVPDIQAYLEEKRAQLALWKDVQREMEASMVGTVDEAKEGYARKLKETFPNKKFEPVGETTPDGDIKILPEHLEKQCEIVATSTQIHELDHRQFDQEFAAGFDEMFPFRFLERWRRDIYWGILKGGRQHAEKEVRGHGLQVEYLEQKLKELQGRCRYEEQRAAGKKRMEEAVKRFRDLLRTIP